MYRARQVSNLGGFLSGSTTTVRTRPNGITAMFTATGQDTANVAEEWVEAHDLFGRNRP